MRILFANTVYPSTLHPEIFGGADTFSKRLCESLVERGHSVQVVRCGPVREHWQPEEVNGVKIATLPVRNIYSPWLGRPKNALVRAMWHLVDDRCSAVPGFEAILDGFRPDVFHSNVLAGLTTGLWSKASGRDVPIVHTLHDYYLTCPRSLRFRSEGRCASTCTSCRVLTGRRRSAAKLVDTVVSVSNRTLEVHREDGVFANGANSIVIRNPPPIVQNEQVPVDAVNRPLVFGFLGRSCIEKGSLELAAAFRDIQALQARLVVAGHVDDVTKARMIEEAGPADIEFVGFVSPEEFFTQIDVMVLPSLWEEPSPMTIGEAFAYSRPVIGSRRGGIPELLDDDRVGWLFEPGERRLQSLISAIAADRASVMAKSGFLKTQVGRRSFEDLVSEYTAVYEQAIRDRRGP